MRNGYTGLRKWDNWGAMFLVLCVFAIDTGLGNVYKVVGSEDYVTQVYQYVSFKEIFGLMPYCLLMIIATHPFFVSELGFKERYKIKRSEKKQIRQIATAFCLKNFA